MGPPVHLLKGVHTHAHTHMVGTWTCAVQETFDMFVEWYHAAASHLGDSEMLLLHRDNVAALVIHSCRGKKSPNAIIIVIIIIMLWYQIGRDTRPYIIWRNVDRKRQSAFLKSDIHIYSECILIVTTIYIVVPHSFISPSVSIFCYFFPLYIYLLGVNHSFIYTVYTPRPLRYCS